MKEAAWGYLILALGVAIIAIMLLIQNLTTTSEENFYLTREVLEASMYDAVDYGTYARSGKLVMSEQKFVEVFLRRFAESVTNNKTYNINFYDIHEYPPKATVLITTDTGETTVSSDTVNININTYLSAILETVTTYNEEFIISKSTETFDNGGNKTSNLKCGTKVITSFQFLDENDPCGYYKIVRKNGELVEFTKDSNYKLKEEEAIDKVEEFCRVRTEEKQTMGQKNIKEYLVRKSSLAREADYNRMATPDYISNFCGTQ